MNDRVAQVIVDSAEKLGFAVERVWPQIVMVTWVTSLFWLIVLPLVMIVCSAGGLIWYRRARAYFADSDHDYETEPLYVIVSVVIGFGIFVIVGAAVGSLPTYLAGFLFPEAQTVLNLARSVK